MEVFTANQMHEKRTDVYKAAMKGPVKITHGHLKQSFILMTEELVGDEELQARAGAEFADYNGDGNE